MNPIRNVFDHVDVIDELAETTPHAEDTLFGAVASSGAGMGLVPWSKGGSWAVEHDSDFDGIPDAFDDHVGPGAHSPFER